MLIVPYRLSIIKMRHFTANEQNIISNTDHCERESEKQSLIIDFF